ncbi:MAG: amidinotransferase [candidate division Zixibacteria bacterium]|nr:amidinotransferase [candidate division Zixibacteria bacterium]
MKYGSQSEVGRIKSILIKHPRDAYKSPENIDSQWPDLNYTAAPDYEKALADYEKFEDLIKKITSDIHYLPQNENAGLDSVYTHDPVVITDHGAILCNMGKAARSGEPSATGDYLDKSGVPILGEINGEGRLEGGDIVWLDQKTLVVGQGYRTNADGIDQLRKLTGEFVEDFIVVPLPHWHGPDECLHLMSFISPIDYDLAVVYSRLMPVPFRQYLLNRGIKLIEVPDDEYDSMACNILAVAPRQCVMLAGNPKTKALLEAESVEVWQFDGAEICLKGAGGPTCLTRPIWRE